jgi:4-amino-4-deoxy-L-arabinose transferase-like glycosyltransferase
MNPISGSSFGVLAGLFLLALPPRVAWAIFANREPTGLNDQLLYFLWAKRIAGGLGYTYQDGTIATYFPVGFPAFAGAIVAISERFGIDEPVLMIKLGNAFVSAAIVVLTYAIARRVLGHTLALVSAFIVLFLPNQVFYAGTAMSEPLFTLLLLCGVYLLIGDNENRPRSAIIVLSGLCFGAAAMTRGVALFLPVSIFFVGIAYLGLRRSTLELSLMMIGFLLLVLPWSVRNSLALDRPVGPASNFGHNLCFGNGPGATGVHIQPTACFEEDPLTYTPRQHEIGSVGYAQRVAVRSIITRPDRIPWLKLRATYFLLNRDDDGMFWSESAGHDRFIEQRVRRVLEWTSNSSYYLVAAMGLLGVWQFVRTRHNSYRSMLVFIVALHVLFAPVLFFGNSRFHYPAIPFIAMFASVGLRLAIGGLSVHVGTERREIAQPVVE